MESKCIIAPICGITCDDCPAKIHFGENLAGIGAQPECKVMIAVIDAFRAQEAYWKHKREIEDKGILSEIEAVIKRLDSAEENIKDLMQGKGGE